MGQLTSFVLGYHGCGSATGARLLSGESFKPSTNEYDWLGHGVYFWEANPRRALDWAHDQKLRSPRVVGAVINPGRCLDLFSATDIEAVRDAYNSLRRTLKATGLPLPRNTGGPDRLRRILDCAVLEHLCTIMADGKYDTVRGIFREGDPIYRTAGFYRKTHVQICVRNLDCIVATFQVPPGQLQPA